ncbi:MAG: ATP-dependent RNA helicase HrpA [Rubrivivax sp.]|nr:ATP-dependent RNA helicase HrpA [Rubrivivax sp.]
MTKPRPPQPPPPPRPPSPPARPLPPIIYPEALPVSARRDEIARALAAHPVIIVSGETGSGKTTQLPKIALELGRGGAAERAGTSAKPRLIGHTQPRRIAASSVAKRIAEELKTPLGEVVGFKVRFQDRLSSGASVKLMTDGILLAETQSDPLLKAYDTLIIDEAHERSLNIDFLLGYLREILPRRPDLKVVVTSATIDAERFATHFASARGPAPVIAVSGRLYPVEVRWRPFEEKRDFGLEDAVAEAVDELWRVPGASPGGGPGDILVFLPGEREIRECADHLRRHLAQAHHAGPPAEILALFARLSQAEQDRVFTTGGGRRIVLATNVAETSLTVPGIRYVIDSGLARVKRYSFRNKVEQLLVEPISQAAANQRAGRCGRVAEGVCIRLYDEASFAGRPRFTDPEILRSSLAGVILRMKSLHLGRVEDFPFLEPPPRKAIADGYALLAELGAVDDANELTAVGRELSRLPLDPRVGRMILAARERDALTEVLVIAAGLSVQDVRDRPLEQQQAADQKHKPFDDEKSEFIGTLALWKWIEAGRGVHGHKDHGGPTAAPVDTHKLSHRQQEQRLREHFISPRRVREWRDIHAQLHTVVAEHGWRLNGTPATYEQVHLALLAGLLGNIGCKADEEDWYLGARGIKFWRHPGANLAKKPGRWIVAAELVETTRLYGRGIAAIEPQWLPALAGHLLKKQLLEPRWEKKAGEVVALERATLYGLVIYNNRRVAYAQVDPAGAREIFIREALVASLAEPEAWDTKLPFIAHNRRTVREVQELEHKARRQDVLVDEGLIEAFYDAKLPADVFSTASFERWYREAARREPKLLHLTREELMRHEAAGITTEAYPRVIRLGGIDCAASYLHEPGDARDGLTVTVPIYALNQVSEERCEWLVPGMLAAKVQALVKSLHQRPRSRLVPLPEFAEAFCAAVPFAQGSLVEALLKVVRERTQLPVQRGDLKAEQLAPHLFMNFVVVDENGRQLGIGRDLAALKAQWGREARSAFQALAALRAAPGAAVPSAATPSSAPPAPAAAAARGGVAAGIAKPAAARSSGAEAAAADEPRRHTAWTFGELPELMEVKRGSQVMVGFPAVVDLGDAVAVEVFDEPDVAARRHRAGLRRLVALQLREPLKYLEKQIDGLNAMAVQYMALGTLEELRAQIIELALERAFLADPLPADEAAFKARIDEGRARLNLIAQEVARQAAVVLAEHAAAQRKLRDSKPPRDVADDITAQLQRLVGKRFIVDTPWAQLQHLPRYLRAVQLRLDKLRIDPARDAARLAELRPLEQRWLRRQAELRGAAHARLTEYRWLLEELRVSLFAQELRTPQPVSAKRLDKVWGQIEG